MAHPVPGARPGRTTPRSATNPGQAAAGPCRDPRPRCSGTRGWQEVQRRRVRAAVRDREPDEEVVGRRLRVLGEHVEVAVLREDPGIDELELGIPPAAALVLLNEPRVGKRRLRVLVEGLHVRVGRRRVEVEVVVLDVLAVVALRASEAEEPLLQDRVLLVPEGQREAEALMVVRDPKEPVLAPAVRAGAGVVVREGIPGGPARRVVLADRAPLPLREVGPPPPPVGLPGLCLREPSLFRRHGPVPPCATRGPPLRRTP
jgi:hypothetical protein